MRESGEAMLLLCIRPRTALSKVSVGNSLTNTCIPGFRARSAAFRRKMKLDYWFSEGFADFYAARALLHSGIWSLEDFVSEQNEMLERYGNSPNPLPNAQVLKDFWTSDVVRQVPYDRGRMLATIWDYRLRRSNSGRTLNDILKQQRLAAQENARNYQDVPAAKLFLEVYSRMSGTDLAIDVARFVEKGELVTLPADLYGTCARIESVTEAGKPPFQKVVLIPGMTPEARADCIGRIGNF